MLNIFLAALFVFLLAVTWIGGWFFGLSLVAKLIVTATLLTLAMATLALRVWVALTNAKGLVNAIAPTPAKKSTADPQKSDQIVALRQQMDRAIQSLKRTKLGARGGAAALNALPWYIIIGPPGSGKTTAILHSGLGFPLGEGAQPGSSRGVSGTRNCDWWFTSDAVLLDTAGRYATDSSDAGEWLAFLDILKKFRPRRPVNGLIVAVSLADVAWAAPDALEDIARRIRARVDEIATRLSVAVPIYVFLTKADLIGGFVEFWDDLRKSERGQTWGMTFKAQGESEPREAFEREFDVLVHALHQRALKRLALERVADQRRRLGRFPHEFQNVRTNVAAFLGCLFEKNAFQETPSLRGVYFSSGTQFGAPGARAAAAMQREYGLALPVPPAPAVPEPKSYFLTDVFRRVLFQDKSLATRTDTAKRRELLARGAVASLAWVVAVSLLVPACFTFSRNRELTRATGDVAHAVVAAKWSDPAGLADGVLALDAAEAHLKRLDAWRAEKPPVQLRWGMYTGDELGAKLRGVYAGAIARAFVHRTRADLEERLRGLDGSPVRSTENFNRQYDELKLYMMLGDPAHLDPAWAAPRLVRQWTLTPHPAMKDEEALLAPHALYFLELMKRGDVAPVGVDRTLVTRARSILAQVPQLERLYEGLVRDANVELAPIRREAIFFGSVAPFVQSTKGVKVPGAYTKPGWLRVRALLGAQKARLSAERWVLGDEKDAGEEDKQVDKLRDLYLERYKNAWRDFLADLHVQDPGNAELAVELLNALSEPEWPYLRLLRTVEENVALDMTPVEDVDPTLVDKAKDALLNDGGTGRRRTVSVVERAFKPLTHFAVLSDGAVRPDEPAPPTGLSHYQALLAKIVATLTDLRDSEGAVTDPRKVSDAFQEAFRATSALLSEQDGFTRPLLSPLLMNPITLTWGSVVKDAGSATGARWETQVWQKWHEKLEGRYPFTNSNNEAALGDFLDFFQPGSGTLWSFYDDSLKATLDQNGTSFVPSRRFRSSIGYTGAFLDVCLKRGQEFTTTLFPPKSDGAAVVFEVNLHSVSSTVGEVTFEAEGVSKTYRNEPERWVTIVWPGKGAHGARLRARGLGGLDEELTRAGDFGIFRLLDDADVKPGTAAGRADGVPTLVATWDLRAAQKGAVVKLDIRPTRNENPFAPGYFRNFTCPRIIAETR